MVDNADRIMRAFVRLKAMRTNYGDTPGFINRLIIDDYHDALGHLRAVGFDIGEFMIPASWLTTQSFSLPDSRNGAPAASNLGVSKAQFLSKIDAVLGYFELLTARTEEERPPIGFRRSHHPG